MTGEFLRVETYYVTTNNDEGDNYLLSHANDSLLSRSCRHKVAFKGQHGAHDILITHTRRVNYFALPLLPYTHFISS